MASAASEQSGEIYRSLLVEFERPLEQEFIWHSYSKLCNAVARTTRARATRSEPAPEHPVDRAAMGGPPLPR